MARKLRNTAPADPFGPTPSLLKGAGRKAVEAVLGALKAGTGMASILSGVLAAALIVYSGYVLYDSFSTEQRAYSSSWELMKYKPEIVEYGAEPSDGKETLASITRDYRGWLTLYDTPIDYPVVQGENDLYYASHDIYQNTSLTGAIYLAAGNDRKLTNSYNLIYGHHMDNGAMFGAMDKYRNESYYRSHREGILIGESGVYDLTVFAAAETDAYESQIYTVGNRAAEVKDFLTGDRSGDAGLGTKVLYYDRETARQAEKIAAFSTCDSAETNGRLVVFARMTARALIPVTLKPETTESVTPRPTAKPAGGSSRSSVTPSPTPRLITTPIPTLEPNPGPYTLTVRYIHLNGTASAQTYQARMMAGEDYSVASPAVEGYVMSNNRVSGRMEYRDTTVTVLYIPEDMAAVNTLILLDEYEVPLGLDNLFAQMGLCTE